MAINSPPQQNIDQTNLMNWLLRLYPNGRSLEQEIIDTSKYNRTNYQTAKQLAMDFLTTLKNTGKIDITARNNENGVAENYIILTSIGKDMVWEYARSIYTTDPSRYMKIIKLWVKEKDKRAFEMYRQLLFREIDANYDICYKLTQPTPKQDVLFHTARIRKLDLNEDKDKIMEIETFLDRAVLVGLLLYETREVMISDDQGHMSPTQMELYYLTDDGLNGIRLFNRQLQDSPDGLKPSSNPLNRDREIETNIFDVPVKKILRIELVASLIYTAFFFIFNTVFKNYLQTNLGQGISSESLSTLLLNNLDNLFPSFFFLGLLILWIAIIPTLLSELIGRIKEWYKKQKAIRYG